METFFAVISNIGHFVLLTLFICRTIINNSIFYEAINSDTISCAGFKNRVFGLRTDVALKMNKCIYALEKDIYMSLRKEFDLLEADSDDWIFLTL